MEEKNVLFLRSHFDELSNALEENDEFLISLEDSVGEIDGVNLTTVYAYEESTRLIKSNKYDLILLYTRFCEGKDSEITRLNLDFVKYIRQVQDNCGTKMDNATPADVPIMVFDSVDMGSISVFCNFVKDVGYRGDVFKPPFESDTVVNFAKTFLMYSNERQLI